MREWFIVGSKLLGIYFLYHALTTLPPSIGFALSILSKSVIIDQGPSNISLFLASTLSGLIMIAFAVALLFKTELIADKLNILERQQPNSEKENKLESGIMLIGIYIFCTKIGGLFQIFADSQRSNKIRDPFAATQPQGLTFSSNYIAPLVTLAASLLLIFGAKHITAFLTKEKQTETEQKVRADTD